MSAISSFSWYGLQFQSNMGWPLLQSLCREILSNYSPEIMPVTSPWILTDWIELFYLPRQKRLREISQKNKHKLMRNIFLKYSPFLLIRTMQIRTTLKFHLTLVRITKIKNTNNYKHWYEYDKQEIFSHCWKDYILMWPLQKSVL